MYEIDARGLRAVSLIENVDVNPSFTETRDGMALGDINEMKANGTIGEFGEGAYDFDEVHVSNDDLDKSRIKQISRY
ncbi:MAG: hypothetical protein ACRYG5_16340 [Janthinobacterium lividum]